LACLEGIAVDSILIIEDDNDVRLMLAEALVDAGYSVNSVYTGTDGIREVKNHPYDLVLLDIMLPYMSGDEVLREMRTFCETPVIIISAKDIVSTKIDFLNLGADDYITKPFDLREVIARVESNIRRSKMRLENKFIHYGHICLDDVSKRVTLMNSELDLTSKEYAILRTLLANPDKVFTKASLYESVWCETYPGNENILKTHISNLRGKMNKISQDDCIETIWGLGYRLKKLSHS
jgi:two component transcriptional regulator, winged helix family